MSGRRSPLAEIILKSIYPSYDYLFDVFSLSEAITHLLKGDGNCAEVQWQLLGLSMPGWVLVAFIGYAALSVLKTTTFLIISI